MPNKRISVFLSVIIILVIKLTACSLYPINSGEGPLATAINDQGDQDLSEVGPYRLAIRGAKGRADR